MYKFAFGKMELPITPAKLTVKIKGNNKTITLANGGDLNLLRAPGLTEISFEATLPMLGKYTFSGEYHRPDHYLDAFEKLMLERTPFYFYVYRVRPDGGVLFDTDDMKVSLEDYTIVEDATKGFDMVVSITLKQYISYVTKTITIEEEDGETVATETATRDGDNAPKGGADYTVKSGDYLWLIAKAQYGDGSKWSAIYEANKDKISNPNLIYPGQVLTIPGVSEIKATSASSSSTKKASSSTKKATAKSKASSAQTTGTLTITSKTPVGALRGTITVSYYSFSGQRLATTKTINGFGAQTFAVAKDTKATVIVIPYPGYSFKISGYTGAWTIGKSSCTCKASTKGDSITIEWIAKK